MFILFFMILNIKKKNYLICVACVVLFMKVKYLRKKILLDCYKLFNDYNSKK